MYIQNVQAYKNQITYAKECAIHAKTISIVKRLQKYSFCIRYKGFLGKAGLKKKIGE